MTKGNTEIFFTQIIFKFKSVQQIIRTYFTLLHGYRLLEMEFIEYQWQISPNSVWECLRNMQRDTDEASCDIVSDMCM